MRLAGRVRAITPSQGYTFSAYETNDYVRARANALATVSAIVVRKGLTPKQHAGDS